MLGSGRSFFNFSERPEIFFIFYHAYEYLQALGKVEHLKKFYCSDELDPCHVQFELNGMNPTTTFYSDSQELAKIINLK